MVPGATSDEASDAAMKILLATRLKSTSVTVTPSVITEETPLLTVRVEIPMAANAWGFPRWFTGNSVVSEVTLLCERPPLIKLTGIPELKSKVSKTKGSKTGL